MVRIKVKEVAKSKGISQSKLSRLADVNVSTIQRIYRNPTTTNINIFTLEKIARALDVNVSELIESVPDERSENVPAKTIVTIMTIVPN